MHSEEKVKMHLYCTFFKCQKKKKKTKKGHSSYRNHSRLKVSIEGFCLKKGFIMFEILRQQCDNFDQSKMTFSFKKFRALIFWPDNVFKNNNMLM